MERQPGVAGFSAILLWHRCKAPKYQFLHQETKIKKQGFVLAFRKTRVRLYVYVLLNASVLLELRPLRTSNSNDKRLIALCFVVIAKNNSLDCFCALLFKTSLSVVCLQGFVGTKCRNSGTSMLAYVSKAPAWRGRVQCHITMAQVQSTKIPAKRQKKGHHSRCPFILAEKQGFEPWLRFSRTTPLAGEPLRPLGYFSVCRILIAFLMLDYDSTRVSQCQ